MVGREDPVRDALDGPEAPKSDGRGRSDGGEGGEGSEGTAPARRGRWWLLAAVLVLAVGAAGLSFALGRADDPAGTPAPSAAAPTTEGEGAPPAEPAEAPDDAADGVTDPDDPSPVAEAPNPALAEADALLDALLGPDPALPPVGLDDPATSDDGVVASLAGVEAVVTDATGPGEVAGPGVRLTVELSNGGADAVAVDQVVVNVYVGDDHAPADPLLSVSEPFSGAVEPGARATGVYVFSLPDTVGDALHVTVSHDPSTPTAVFTGRLPS